ncbi:MAG: hypothetical protein GXZ11_06000 [Tissierellia bacterium]|nr:hypothetical protein [Tissierellia bacterium]
MKNINYYYIFTLIMLLVFSILLTACFNNMSNIPKTEELELISVSSSGDMRGGYQELKLQRKDEGVFLSINDSRNWRCPASYRVYKCSEDAMMVIQEELIKQKLWKIREIKDRGPLIYDAPNHSWITIIKGDVYPLFSGQSIPDKYRDKFSEVIGAIVKYKIPENRLESRDEDILTGELTMFSYYSGNNHHRGITSFEIYEEEGVNICRMQRIEGNQIVWEEREISDDILNSVENKLKNEDLYRNYRLDDVSTNYSTKQPYETILLGLNSEYGDLEEYLIFDGDRMPEKWEEKWSPILDWIFGEIAE